MNSPWSRTMAMVDDASPLWRLAGGVTLSCRVPLVAGIVNVTPD